MVVGGFVHESVPEGYSNQTHMLEDGSLRWIDMESRPSAAQELACGRIRRPDGTVNVITVGGYPENRYMETYDVQLDQWSRGLCDTQMGAKYSYY